MEGFFYESIEVDTEIIDFTLARYGNSILDLPHDQAFDVILAGLKVHQRDRLWDSYKACLPFMFVSKDKYVSFEEFCEKAEKPVVKTIHTKDEILGNVKNLINNIKWRK